MALFPILAITSGSLRLMLPLPGLRSPRSPLVGVAGLLGDNPLADTFLAGAGDDLREGDGDVPGVRDGVRGEGVLFLEPGPPTVRRLVGRLGPGEEEAAGDLDLGVMEVMEVAGDLDLGVMEEEVAGDLDLVLGEPGTERVVRGEEGRETERGEAGTERWRPEQQSSSRSSLLFLYPSVCNFLTLLVSSPKSFSPLKLLLILGELILAGPITGLFGAEFVLDIFNLQKFRLLEGCCESDSESKLRGVTSSECERLCSRVCQLTASSRL